MNIYLNTYFLALIYTSLFFSANLFSEDNTTEHKEVDSPVKQRFIPVELFTGAKWDGKHELAMKAVSTSTCVTFIGKKRPCSQFQITGPFKTEENNTKIEWRGDEIPYYRRIFSIRESQVESFFTINNSKDGLVRIYDKRKQWGTRTYDGLGSKFPLGYWKQGEVREYNSRRPTRIEIIELEGPNKCLTFRWTIGEGKRRNQDNIYTFCPDLGFTEFQHYNVDVEQKN
ncbi:hypothetical protein [Pseudoteredinibacter isoporae]|uniref:Uncharacterized protein n=1 Tax=Pseudoteredinibacter isoporae TaxID=570281 RepID=A0A7X0JQA1_9GAMM|nr:hypothetical protein [Pseudoteredinibacter isoporae]MBB6520207.1 hypothetical protein [Pseudoteredinibacter isoporae]NHO85779.1 hypothetical protein [Pseudoteredinibacter isoporae]NIB25769.1 hypothetical protein [Pseudoteredinibacter isoporae]